MIGSELRGVEEEPVHLQVKARRQARKIPIAEFALRAAVDDQQYRKFEQGRYTFGEFAMERIEKALE